MEHIHFLLTESQSRFQMSANEAKTTVFISFEQNCISKTASLTPSDLSQPMLSKSITDGKYESIYMN